MFRKFFATWAVLQFLIVFFFTAGGISTTRDGLDFGMLFIGLPVGIVAGVISLALPWGILAISRVIWDLFNGNADEIGETVNNLTLTDIAGIASALHPRTGAILNVAANIDARNQALTVVQTPPTQNPVDDERL
jgi:hypothetical protein